MKKVILTLAAILCCASLFTSCNKDSGSGSDKPTTVTPVYVSMTVEIPASDDMLEYLNMSVSYEAGNEKNTETVTAVTWSKTFQVKLPGSINVKRTVTLKDGKTIPAEEPFSYASGYAVSWKFLDANSKEIRAGGMSGAKHTAKGVGSKVKELVEKGKFDTSVDYSFDKDGNVL